MNRKVHVVGSAYNVFFGYGFVVMDYNNITVFFVHQGFVPFDYLFAFGHNHLPSLLLYSPL